MNYYQVVIASNRQSLDEPLTYHEDKALSNGQVVRVPLAKGFFTGVVVTKVDKPRFKTKPIKQVVENVVLPPPLIKLARLLATYYAAPLSSAFALLLPSGVHLNRRAKPLESTATQTTSKLQDLTTDQAAAIKEILATDANTTITLHGDTGTGKTRVYSELARAARDEGLGSIIMVPEIGLTAQLSQELETVLSDVFIIHSKQTESERHQQWLSILNHPAPVVVGPRSALFAPVKKLGLIVVDESHEQTYKQDTSPRYNALRVARLLADLQKARLVLGSATPTIHDMYLARSSDAPIIRMTKLAAAERLEFSTKLVDMREHDNRGKLLAPITQSIIEQTLSRGGQVLIFHNRRGSSTSVICENCGYLAGCPHCLMPLTHHHDSGSLRCHVCGHSEPVKISCPSCKKSALKFRGYGTKHLEEKLKQLFGAASVARFDGDSRLDESITMRLKDLKSGKINIIVGTQMIAKGLDLPKLETVVVPLTDSLISLPDYTAGERFFEHLYQVAGRVGRHRSGQLVLQSYNPDLQLTELALKRDYESFYELELGERRAFNYPPFSYLLLLSCERKTKAGATKAATDFAERLKDNSSDIEIIGPAPAFYEKSRSGWRWQIVVKAKQRKALTEIVSSLPSGWRADLDPLNLL